MTKIKITEECSNSIKELQGVYYDNIVIIGQLTDENHMIQQTIDKNNNTIAEKLKDIDNLRILEKEKIEEILKKYDLPLDTTCSIDINNSELIF